MSEPGIQETEESKTPAGIAGASGGTLVAVIASGLEDSNPIKQWLFYSAPTITILLSAVWFWVQVTIRNYIRDKQVKNLTAEAKDTLEEALRSKDTSAEHKKVLRNKLEQLEIVNVDRLLSRVENIALVTIPESHKQ